MGANGGADRTVSKLEREIHIDAEPAAVYAKLMDPGCLGQWVTIQDELLEAPSGDLKAGDELVQRCKVAGQKFKLSWHVDKADPPHKTVWSGTGPLGTKARVTYDLAANDGGTRFTYTNEYDLPGGIAGKLAGRAVVGASGSEADRTLERLKKLIEKG
jgi:carbon monoxide dehydrogenase subunit G